MTSVLVETEDFVAVSRRVYTALGDPMADAYGRLLDALQPCGAMAGDDPGGVSWAASYDPAARSALSAATEVIDTCYRLSAMFARTAHNYAAADHASTPGVRHAIAGLPRPTEFLGRCPPPSARGGTGGTPHGWGLIKDVVGYLWPDGDPGRLRSAGAAWSAAQDVLYQCGAIAQSAWLANPVPGVPEAPDIERVCTTLGARVNELSAVHGALATACNQLADHIDDAHNAVKGELESLLDWTAGIEFTGAALSWCTFGGSEGVAQGAESIRIGVTAARVGTIIARFISLARRVAHSIAVLAERADALAAELRLAIGTRLTEVVVRFAHLLPPRLGEAFTLGADGALVAGGVPRIFVVAMEGGEAAVPRAAGLGSLERLVVESEALSSDFEVVGAGRVTRRINFRPRGSDPRWGLTRKHIAKHLFGDGPYSLRSIDPAGTSDVWIQYLQELAGRAPTRLYADGVIDIVGTFARSTARGTFRLGMRLAPDGKGGFDLVTILTRQ